MHAYAPFRVAFTRFTATSRGFVTQMGIVLTLLYCMLVGLCSCGSDTQAKPHAKHSSFKPTKQFRKVYVLKGKRVVLNKNFALDTIFVYPFANLYKKGDVVSFNKQRYEVQEIVQIEMSVD